MKTAVVVDDALFMRSTIRKMLTDIGFNVVGEASNGKEAIALYREHSPSLMTMDITMPVMSGIDAVKEIKNDFPEANIVVVSALGQQKLVKEALSSGARDFVTKPFDLDHFKKRHASIL